MTCAPWYNTYICKKLHGNVFEGFIINARTDRYNITEKLFQKKTVELPKQPIPKEKRRSLLHAMGRGCV